MLNILQCIGQPLTAKNYLDQNVNSSKFEKLSLRKYSLFSLPRMLSWTELCLPKFYIEALTPNVTVFGDMAVSEVIKIK